MVQFSNSNRAMEAGDHSKNGASLKSQMSRENRMRRTLLFFAALCVSIASTFAQDIITLKNGEDIQALVQEIGEVDIMYKKFDNPNGPNYTLKKSEILMIRYANGSKDVFENTATPISTKTDQQSVQSQDQNEQPRVDTNKKMYIWAPKVEKYTPTNILDGVRVTIEITDSRIITPKSDVKATFAQISDAIIQSITDTYGKRFISNDSDIMIVIEVQAYAATFYTGMYRGYTRYAVKIGEKEEIIEQENFQFNVLGYSSGKKALNESFNGTNVKLFQFLNDYLKQFQ